MTALRILLALVGLLILGPGAEAQVNPTKLFFVFTTGAKANIGTGNLSTWVSSAITQINSVAGASLMSTSYQSAGFSTTFCCGRLYLKDDPVTGDALQWVMGDPKRMKERDDAHADVVVVVTDNGSLSDVASRSLMDCSKTGDAAAQLAAVGFSLVQGYSTYSELAVSLGRLQCGLDEDAVSGSGRGFSWASGTDATHCNVYATFLSTATSSTPKPVSNWTVPEGGLAGVAAGNGPDPDTANTNMTPNCVNYTGGLPNNTITCAPTGSCAVTGINATCSHTRTNLDHRGPPTCGGPSPQPSCSTVTTVNSVGGFVSFTCTGGFFFNTGLYSNPSKNLVGFPTGDSTHNQVAAMDTRNSAVTSTLRRTQIAPMLIQAGQGK